MKDPQRIPTILEALTTYWEQNPDLRLGQILANAARDKEAFYLTDEELLTYLKQQR